MTRSLGGVAALLASLALAAPVANAAVTLGSSMPAPPTDALVCEGADCTIAATSLPGRELAAPFDGVLVRWRYAVDPEGSSPGSPRVLRPGPSGAYADVTPSSPAAGAPQIAEGIVTAALRVPVKRGDLLGVRLQATHALPIADRPAADVTFDVFAPMLEATPRVADDSVTAADFELLVNADLEPDADQDGFGDETQDRCPGVAELESGTCATLQGSWRTLARTLAVGKTERLVIRAQPSGVFARTMSSMIELPAALVADTLPPECSALDSRHVSCTYPASSPPRVLPGRPARPQDYQEVAFTVRAVAPGVSLNGRPGHIAIGGSVRAETVPAGAALAAYIDTNRRPRELVVLAMGACSNRWEASAADDNGVIEGSRMGDLIQGGPGVEGLLGHAGDDCLEGAGGNDGLSGGTGVDRLSGGKGRDELDGSAGSDRLGGGKGRDTLDGGPGADRLSGGKGRDRLLGGPGADRIAARDGARDVVVCGRGADRATVDAKDRVRGCEIVSRPKRR